MKKSPYWFFLFIRSCCSCSFSPCWRLHVLRAGSNWIEFVCGGVPVRLAPQNPHTSRLSKCNRDRRADTEAAAQRTKATSFKMDEHCHHNSFCSFHIMHLSSQSLSSSYISFPSPRPPSLQTIIACLCSEKYNLAFKGKKQPTHYK